MSPELTEHFAFFIVDKGVAPSSSTDTSFHKKLQRENARRKLHVSVTVTLHLIQYNQILFRTPLVRQSDGAVVLSPTCHCVGGVQMLWPCWKSCRNYVKEMFKYCQSRRQRQEPYIYTRVCACVCACTCVYAPYYTHTALFGFGIKDWMRRSGTGGE